MTEADTTESLAERLAAQGRDALVERLRGAYADAAAAHSDIVRLDDARIEQMVQSAADRADGLQWRRALATVASQELGIELSTALSHPAVARAQKLVGAPSYEDSLAELVGHKYSLDQNAGGPLATGAAQPSPAPAAPAHATDGPSAGPHAGEPSAGPVEQPEPEQQPEPEREPEVEAPIAPTAPAAPALPSSRHAGEAVIEEPEPLDDEAGDDEFLPPPTPLRAVPPAPATPVAPADTARPAADLAAGAHSATPSAGRPIAPDPETAATAVHRIPPPLPTTDEHHPPQPTHTIGGGAPRPGYGPAADLHASNVTPLHGGAAESDAPLGFDAAEHDLDNDQSTAAWDPHSAGAWDEDEGYEEHELEEADEALHAAAHGDEPDGELRISAFHLGGVANLPTNKEPIDVLLSANGLDILQPSGEIVGRLGWAEIENLEVPIPRGRRRRRANRDRAELVVRTRHGDASFEVPGFSPEELQETVEPVMGRFNRLARPTY